MKKLIILLFALLLSGAVVFSQPTDSRGHKGETMATFKGQEVNRAFGYWVNKNVNYPSACAEQGIEGRVIVSFILEPDSTLSNIKIVRSLHPLLDSAVVQLVRNSPKEWTPRYDSLGIPQRLVMNLPVIFQRD